MINRNENKSWIDEAVNKFFLWLNKSSLAKVKTLTVVPLSIIGFTSIFIKWTSGRGIQYHDGGNELWESIIIGVVICAVIYFDYSYFLKKFNLERTKFEYELKHALIEALKDDSLPDDLKKDLIKKI